MKFIIACCLTICLFIFNTCETLTLTKEDLYGNWQAVALTEEGDTLKVNINEIKLSFTERIYQFESTLRYKEAGPYYLQSNLLLTKDTLGKKLLEKGVEITKVNQDSLFLRMNEEGKERLLVMVREE